MNTLVWNVVDDDCFENPLPVSPRQLSAFNQRDKAEYFIVARGEEVKYSITEGSYVVLVVYDSSHLITVNLHLSVDSAKSWAEGFEAAWKG